MRPKDVPQPVHPHESHQMYRKQDDIPGPGHYDVIDALTTKRSVTIPKAQRLGKEQLDPSDMRTKGERDQYLCNPGPVYDVSRAVTYSSIIPRVLASPFPKAHRFSNKRNIDNDVGPGTYDVEDSSIRLRVLGGVMLKRYGVAHVPDNPPPGHYQPEKKSIGKLKAFFGSAPARGSIGRPATSMGMASLASIDNAMKHTRPVVSRGITFPSKSATENNEKEAVGPGYYNVEERLGQNARATTFRNSVRILFTHRDKHKDDVPLLHPDLDRSSTPAVSFPKAHVSRGIPIEADQTLPGPVYNVREKIGRDKRACFFSKAARFHDFAAGGARPENRVDASSALYTSLNDTRTTCFATTERRIRLSDRDCSVPGPGNYDFADFRKTNRYAGKSFPKAARKSFFRDSSASPGPAYNPNDNLTRQKSTRDITFGRSSRRQGSTADCVMDLAYPPNYTQIDKNERGAILYLTG